MNKDEVVLAIAEDNGLTVQQAGSKIEARLMRVLDYYSGKFDWPDATTSSPTNPIASGAASILIPATMFKPISVIITLADGRKYQLDRMEYTDFKANSADIQTTDTPTHFAYHGRRLWIGPGVLTQSANLDIDSQRRLGLNDIEMFPDGNILVNHVDMVMAKKGSPEYISARADWKDGMQSLLDTFKNTAMKTSRPRQDAQILRNTRYINSFKTGV